MSLDIPWLSSDEQLFMEKATTPEDKIQKAQIYEPVAHRIYPTIGNQERLVNLSNNYQFILPKEHGYIVNYNNSSQGYFELSLCVESTDARLDNDSDNNYWYAKVEPWRMWDRCQVYVNGRHINPDDNNIQIRMTQDVMDKPLEWFACSDGGSLGADVAQGNRFNPFLSSQASVLSTDARNTEAQSYMGTVGGVGGNMNFNNGNSGFIPAAICYGLTGAGPTGAYANMGDAVDNFSAYGTPYGTSWSVDSTPAMLNSAIRVNKAGGQRYWKRFRLPLSLVTGGCLVGDPNSLLPTRYLNSCYLVMYANRDTEFVTQFFDLQSIGQGLSIGSIPQYLSAGTNWCVTPLSNAQVYIKDFRLVVYTAEVAPAVDASYRSLIDSGRFWYKTSTTKTQPWAGSVFAPYGRSGQIVFPLPLSAISAKSVDVVLTDPAAIASPYSGWKSTFIDNGIWMYNIVVDDKTYPVNTDQTWNGYQSLGPYAECYQEAYTAYSNYRRSKLSGDYQSMFNFSSITSPYIFSGYNQVATIQSLVLGNFGTALNVDGSLRHYTTGMPLPGGYPLALPFLGLSVANGVVTQAGIASVNDVNPISYNTSLIGAHWYPNAQRQFRMVADLQSVNHSENLYSGKAISNIQVTAWYNGLRSYYFTASRTTPTTGTQAAIPIPIDCTTPTAYAVARCNMLLQIARSQCMAFA
jgi:hypothetical protein